MASSRVMTSTSSTSSDSARRRSESMDGLIRDLCVGKMNVVESERSEIIGDRRVPISVERVQKDEFEAITLEDFLAVSENNYQQPMEREKRKTVVDFVDEAELQKQKRMIKNRKSAARSWERKQVSHLLANLFRKIDEFMLIRGEFAYHG